MAKSIAFFDKEHTGKINLAAMEDTQLKENLVQDIAAGGDEAPTATAVKEAVDTKMAKADIVNDITTGGTDKALSAEQGKVLDGKKVDKVVTPASVYVTEGSKPLSDFAMKAEMSNKTQDWTIQVKSTDIQFKDTWAASKTGVIPNEACPSLNFMLTKDMMAQIPNAKIGDTIYLGALKEDTGFAYNLYLYGRLHSLTAVNTPDFYRLQDNSGDISGCGTLQVFSGNFLSGIMHRKPNFFTMKSTTENSNIPVGLTSLSTIAFAPGTDTANFAHALKQGDLIEVSKDSGVPYTLMFVRYATEADNASQKYLIVGQAAEPIDMTGYLFCRVFTSVYDRDGAVPEVITSRYQPDQVEVGRRYNLQIRPSDPSDQISINGLTINSTNLNEFNFLVRMRFNSGALFRLLLGSSIITMQVVTSTYSTDGRLTVICLSKGDRTVVRL